jgi:multidrug efflux pump
VPIWGQRRWSMRLWMDPTKLGGYGLTPLDVRTAINRENVELPSGSIEGPLLSLPSEHLGLLTTPEEFNNLIIKQENDQVIRFIGILEEQSWALKILEVF